MGKGGTFEADFLCLFLGASQSEGQLYRHSPWPPGWQAPFHVPSRGASPYSHFTEQETKAERMRDTPRLGCSLTVVITGSPLGDGHFLFCNVVLRAPL